MLSIFFVAEKAVALKVKNIRTQYARNMRKQKSGSGGTRKKWYLEDKLAFLADYYVSRSTQSNLCLQVCSVFRNSQSEKYRKTQTNSNAL